MVAGPIVARISGSWSRCSLVSDGTERSDTSSGSMTLAPYWANHHLEHHLLVFVPCWRLRDAHALLVSKGHGPRMEVAPGYLDVLRRAVVVDAG